MRDKGPIFGGLVVFLVLVTFPIWFGLVAGEQARAPELQLPVEGGQCIADTEFMRTEHMQLLMEWRDDVVRRNDRIYTASDGRQYHKSLSGTCMSCHADKQAFCDKCHDYVGVVPYCWDCHVVPQGEH